MKVCSIARIYHFEAGHWLPKVPDGHKCKRPHGHNYKFEVILAGAPSAHIGWLIDFFDLDKIVQPIINTVDHRMLNDIPGLENPTAELIADWIFDRLTVSLEAGGTDRIKLACVRVYETDTCMASVTDILPSEGEDR